MKKTYIEPMVELTIVNMLPLMGASQVKTGGKLGDEYNENDVTYSRRHNDIWDDEEEEEEEQM